MSTDPFLNLQTESNQQQGDFLRTELELCLTFTVLAATKYEAGNRRSAEQSMTHAREVFESVAKVLSDSDVSKHMTGEELQEFTAELERLRERLDGLRPIRLPASTTYD